MYINPPFNYTGSKFKILDQILPHFDRTKSQFVDLFTGGGSVYTNVLYDYEYIVINDIIPELIQIHKELFNNHKTFIEKVKQIIPSKTDAEKYLLLREDFNNEKTSEKLYALMLSSTNNMLRFNKSFKYNSTFGKRSWNTSTDNKMQKFLEHIKDFDTNNISFQSKSFDKIVIEKSSMVYIDPPYSNTEAGYNAYWDKDDDRKLFNYCNELNENNHSFIVSGAMVHDGKRCELLDLLLKETSYNYIELDFNYNNVSKKGKKETKEIIIKNF